jgi:hypothetical protein
MQPGVMPVKSYRMMLGTESGNFCTKKEVFTEMGNSNYNPRHAQRRTCPALPYFAKEACLLKSQPRNLPDLMSCTIVLDSAINAI